MERTMYDKLGDLLSQTLETGAIPFVKVEEEPPFGSAGADAARPSGRESAAENRSEPSGAKNASRANSGKDASFPGSKKEGKGSYTVYKFIPPDIASSYAVLGLSPGSSRKAVKSAYKECLKRLHPDKHADDPEAERHATEQTRLAVEAYRRIMAFLRA